MPYNRTIVTQWGAAIASSSCTKGKTGGIMKDCMKTLFGALILGSILILPAYSADTFNIILAAIIGQ